MKSVHTTKILKVIGAFLVLLSMIVGYVIKNESKFIYKTKHSKQEKAKDTTPPKRY